MRLINAQKFLDFDSDCLEEFLGDEIPPYAILSHFWNGLELLFRDIARLGQDDKLPARVGYPKIAHSCEQALNDCLSYVWIDTCCIDKSSSAELQEAINSMFSWYARAEVCYVYLGDLDRQCPRLCDESITGLNKHGKWFDVLASCSWWRRGWTLQELLAPTTVCFYSAGWTQIGKLQNLAHVVSEITGIQLRVLLREETVSQFSVAQRMSWAAGRRTTRVEDTAYSLLGIFGVSMPLLYGEGNQAFIRLQETIIQRSTDESILAWQPSSDDRHRTSEILASWPDDFALSKTIIRRDWCDIPRTFELTNAGLRIGPFLSEDDCHDSLGVLKLTLNCQDVSCEKETAVALNLAKTHPSLVDPNNWDRYVINPAGRLTYTTPIINRKAGSIIVVPLQIQPLQDNILRRPTVYWFRLDRRLRIVSQRASDGQSHVSQTGRFVLRQRATVTVALKLEHVSSREMVTIAIAANRRNDVHEWHPVFSLESPSKITKYDTTCNLGQDNFKISKTANAIVVHEIKSESPSGVREL